MNHGYTYGGSGNGGMQIVSVADGGGQSKLLKFERAGTIRMQDGRIEVLVNSPSEISGAARRARFMPANEFCGVNGDVLNGRRRVSSYL